MIVIAVVATLATIGVVSYFGIKKSAAMSVLIDNTKKAGTAIDVVRASRPAELADVVEGSTVTRISNKFEASAANQKLQEMLARYNMNVFQINSSKM